MFNIAGCSNYFTTVRLVLTKPLGMQAAYMYVVPVLGQDKLGGLRQKEHPAEQW